MPDAASAHPSCVVCRCALDADPAVILDEYRLVPCRDCGTWNMDPRPSASAQTALHDSDAYHDHAYLAHRRAKVDALDRRCAAIFKRIGVFLDLASLRGERVLDIGCDIGQFIASAARQFGIVPVGVDVAHLAIERARAAGVDAYHCTVEEAPASLRSFPVIMAIDVIEHVADPDEFCRAIADRLRPGGVAYVETPNIDSTVYRVGRALCRVSGGLLAGTWHRLFPREHIQYFRPDGLRRVAERAGLRVLMQESRVLPPAEIAVGRITRTALGALQILDRFSGEKLLRWAILGVALPPSAEGPGARAS